MRYLLTVVLCLLAAACSQSQKGIGETFKLAIFGTPDVELTPEQIHDIPYASIYARINDGSQIFMVLAYAENGDLKWVSRDKAMLVTRNGRLVKTIGLTDNLMEVTNLASDPLLHGQNILDGAEWTHTQSWTEKQQLRSATFTSRFSQAGTETITILNVPHTYIVINEDVTVEELNEHYQNRFWLEPGTGVVRKAQQFAGPGEFPIETITLNPYKP